MIRVFIDGAAGTTGLEIADRLRSRGDIDLIVIEEAARKSLTHRRDALNAADIAILCLPDDAARESVTLIDNPHTRVIDASTAHRTHPDWCYGLPELGAAFGYDVANAKRVSNPGCYPTGFLALIVPLVRAGIVPRDWPICVNAVSGYSGGGNAMIAEFEAMTVPDAWRTYALSLAHKHVAEMQCHATLAYPPIFAPSVANQFRGMIVDVPLLLAAMPGAPKPHHIIETLTSAYASSPIISVHGDYNPANLALSRCANTDKLDLFVFSRDDGSQVRLVATLDNLGKGAAGACVQSLNVMAGVDQTTGLRL